MSDHMLKLIPAERGFVPKRSTHERAIRKLQEFTPDGEEVEVRVYPHLEFIDQGENLEAILCPACKRRLEINHSDDDPIDDWWYAVNDAADVHHGEDVFELNPRAVCRMPCCQAKVKFIDLEFDLPGGFSKFALTAFNPEIDDLTATQLRELETILGCSLKVIWAYY